MPAPAALVLELQMLELTAAPAWIVGGSGLRRAGRWRGRSARRGSAWGHGQCCSAGGGRRRRPQPARGTSGRVCTHSRRRTPGPVAASSTCPPARSLLAAAVRGGLPRPDRGEAAWFRRGHRRRPRGARGPGRARARTWAGPLAGASAGRALGRAWPRWRVRPSRRGPGAGRESFGEAAGPGGACPGVLGVGGIAFLAAAGMRVVLSGLEAGVADAALRYREGRVLARLVVGHCADEGWPTCSASA